MDEVPLKRPENLSQRIPTSPLLASRRISGESALWHLQPGALGHASIAERDFFIDNLLVRIHFIIEMIRWTGLAPWEFEFPFPGSLTSTFLKPPPQSIGIAPLSTNLVNLV